MARNNEKRASLFGGTKLLLKQLDAIRVERIRWLIKQKNSMIIHEGRSKPKTLSHPKRILSVFAAIIWAKSNRD